MKVEIWSDVVCPWCYIGKRRFERAVEEFDGEVEVIWRSFELNPGAATSYDKPLDELLASKYRTSPQRARQMIEQMTENAAQEGLEFNLMESQGGNTLDAHRLIHFAAERDKASEMKERLLSAYMTEGRAISDPDVLADLAEEIGLDRETVEIMLSGDDYVEAVRRDEATANQVGVRGVPFFLVGGRYGVSGAQPSDALLDVMERARDEAEPDSTPANAGASCDEDGCDVDVASAE